MAAPAPQPAAAEAPLHPVIGIFLSPVAAIEALVSRPQFWPALVLMTVIGMASMTIAYQRGVLEHAMREKMESSPGMDRMPPEQKQRAIDMSVKWGAYLMVGGAVVGPAISMLLFASVFLLLTNVILGGGAKFRQLFSVVTHAWLPNSLYSLIAIPIVLAKDAEGIDIQNLVPMANLSLLFDRADQKKLYAVGSSVDLFSFWVITLLVLGISRLTGKSKGLVAAVVLAPWALYVFVVKVLMG